jgi:cytidylate kinase
MKNVPFNVRLPADLVQRLKRIVRRDYGDIHGAQSHMIREMLEEGCSKRERKRRKR